MKIGYCMPLISRFLHSCPSSLVDETPSDQIICRSYSQAGRDRWIDSCGMCPHRIIYHMNRCDTDHADQRIRDSRFSTLGPHCRFTNWLLQSWSWIVKKLHLEQHVYPVCMIMLCFVACWLLNADERNGVEPKLLSQLGNWLQAKMAHISSKYGQVQIFYIL